MITIQEIEIFLAVVEKRNMSRAAASLFMSQSTLSHRLQSLENKLSLKLFLRRRGQRTMELTPQGLYFLDLAERWLSLWQETQQLHQRVRSHQIAVGGIASLNNYVFPELYRKIFLCKEPQIKLYIRSTQSSALYPALERHELDIGFSVQPALYSNICNRPIFSEEEILIRRGLPRRLDSRFDQDVSPRDLDPEREVLYHFHPDYTTWHHSWWDYYTEPLIATGDPLLLESFLETPDSWAIVPMSLGLQMQKKGGMVLHRLTNPPPHRVCYMLTPRVPRPGKEECLAYFQSCLDEFLKQGEQDNILVRIV